MIKSIVTYSIIVMTVGILRLVYHWFPEWFLNCTHSKCSLESAERVLVVVSNPRHIDRFSHNSIDSLLCVYSRRQELFQKKYRRAYIRSVTIRDSVESM